MSPNFRRSDYEDAIEKVRSAHADRIKPASATVVCPKCGTSQVITDAPGMRTCVKCGFEFKRLV